MEISIHAAQEGCDQEITDGGVKWIVISIHAAQEGCDCNQWRGETVGRISIHAAQEGCDVAARVVSFVSIAFQSTQPKRAATSRASIICSGTRISIHAAQEGCDIIFFINSGPIV